MHASTGQFVERPHRLPTSTPRDDGQYRRQQADDAALAGDPRRRRRRVDLIACDTQAGEAALCRVGRGRRQDRERGRRRSVLPDGASLDVDGNLFRDSANGNGNKTAQVWVVLRDLGDSGSSGFCLPGGYRKPFGKMDGG
jgi:hypothetical protein